MYLVPLDKPKNCNKCPFGFCFFSHPAWVGVIDKDDERYGKYGYMCEITKKEFIAKRGEDIKPTKCPLKERKNPC